MTTPDLHHAAATAQMRYDIAAEAWDQAAANFGDHVSHNPVTVEEYEAGRKKVREARAKAEAAKAELKTAKARLNGSAA